MAKKAGQVSHMMAEAEKHQKQMMSGGGQQMKQKKNHLMVNLPLKKGKK